MTLRVLDTVPCVTDDCENDATISERTVRYDDPAFGVIAGYVCWTCADAEEMVDSILRAETALDWMPE